MLKKILRQLAGKDLPVSVTLPEKKKPQKTKIVNGINYIETELATAMIQGIRKAVLGSRTDEQIFAADQRKLEAYQRAIRKLQ